MPPIGSGNTGATNPPCACRIGEAAATCSWRALWGAPPLTPTEAEPRCCCCCCCCWVSRWGVLHAATTLAGVCGWAPRAAEAVSMATRSLPPPPRLSLPSPRSPGSGCDDGNARCCCCCCEPCDDARSLAAGCRRRGGTLERWGGRGDPQGETGGSGGALNKCAPVQHPAAGSLEAMGRWSVPRLPVAAAAAAAARSQRRCRAGARGTTPRHRWSQRRAQTCAHPRGTGARRGPAAAGAVWGGGGWEGISWPKSGGGTGRRPSLRHHTHRQVELDLLCAHQQGAALALVPVPPAGARGARGGGGGGGGVRRGRRCAAARGRVARAGARAATTHD